MNTSFGPRIDADRWDFHDGIDLPAPVGTPVHAMADGVVHRAGPADKTGRSGFRLNACPVSKSSIRRTDKDDLFLVYLHLDSIAEGVIPGAQVKQGDVIGAVGQEDATYPHLHFEFRKGGPEQVAAFTRCTTCPTSTRRTSRSSVWIAVISTATMARKGR